jgi:hypothetical protein
MLEILRFCPVEFNGTVRAERHTQFMNKWRYGMGLGDMLGKAAGALGGTDDIMAKISESGIDLSALSELDADGVTSMLAEKGIDLSMLEGLGISVEDVIEKVKAHLG